MPDFFPTWGERSADIVPQVQYWSGVNYRNQESNLGRRGDYDRQAIANQQNYFQANRAIEQEDANRQLAAQELARREAADRGRLTQGAYQFQSEQDFRNRELAARIEADRRATIPKPVAAIPTVSPLQYVAELNAHIADLRAKTDPAKFNHDAIAGLVAKLPPEIQPNVYYQPEDFKFHFSKPAAVGMGNARQAEAYNFSPTTGTGTSPVVAAPPAATVMPQWSNQGGGYTPQTPSKPLTPELARDYKRRYGSRTAAEAAAKADGYSWPP